MMAMRRLLMSVCLSLGVLSLPALAAESAVERLGDVVRVHPQPAQPLKRPADVAMAAPVVRPSDTSAYQRITDTSAAPFAAIGYLDITLLNGVPRRCTGTVVAARVVLTSAGCLKPGRDVDGALAAQIRFIPGQTQSGAGQPVSQPFAASSYWYYEMPTVYYDQADFTLNYAAVFFHDPVTSLTAFAPIAFDLVPGAASVTGYATTAAGDDASKAMWRAGTTVTGQAPRQITLPIGFDQGLSGTAVIETSTGRIAAESAQRFRGQLLTYAGGTPIAGAFRAPQTVAGEGEVILDFTDSATAQLTTPWGVRQIQRFSFVTDGAVGGSPGAPYPENGFWWNPAQPGIGVLVEVQNSSMMMATLDYDAAGRPTWAFASNAMIIPLLFAAPSSIVTGGPPDTGAWHPVAGVASGQLFVLQVKATDSMVLSLADGALMIPLSRFRF
jgi:V8-like Glu-specific endopeptidase